MSKPTPSKILADLGAHTVDYRYAAAWRRGVLAGYVYTGDTPMMIVSPSLEDDGLAMPLTTAWKQAACWHSNLRAIPKRAVLVEVDAVKEVQVTAARHMSRSPHTCRLCGGPALVMSTQVHCTSVSCPNYDPAQ